MTDPPHNPWHWAHPGDPPSDDGQRATLLWTGILLVGIGALVGTDLVLDARAGGALHHLLVEAAILVAAAGGAVFLFRQWNRERRAALLARAALEGAERESEQQREEAERWRSEASRLIHGLGAAIDKQFDAWKLTPAEKEVGLLLLKGLALKEAAAVRGASERTVRDQARAVYRKAGLAGRAELSAFFLEDLLLPSAADPPLRA